ncbi:hypothetical protein A2U01_0078699, partial [Trifolium medium]|nr:hypothetical protein [Trifolium medium]
CACGSEFSPKSVGSFSPASQWVVFCSVVVILVDLEVVAFLRWFWRLVLGFEGYGVSCSVFCVVMVLGSLRY